MEEYSTPSGKGRGYNPLQAFPARQPARRGRKGPVAGVEVWTDPGPGSLLIPAPGRGAQNHMQAEEGRQGQGPSHATAPSGFPHLPPGLCSRQGTELRWSWGGTVPDLPGSSSSAAGSSSRTCSLYPEGRVPATGAGGGLAPLAVLVQGGQALPAAPTATTMRRKASGSGSSACRTR